MDQEFNVIYCTDCGRIIEDTVGLSDLEILDILTLAEEDDYVLRCEDCELAFQDYDCGFERI